MYMPGIKTKYLAATYHAAYGIAEARIEENTAAPDFFME